MIGTLVFLAATAISATDQGPAGKDHPGPGLASPSDRAEILPELRDGRITFRWHPVPEASAYRIHVAESDSLLAASGAFDVTDTAAYLTLGQGSPGWVWGREYFWKVSALLSDGSWATSPFRSFRIPSVDPSAPRFLIDGDGVQDAPLAFRLPLETKLLRMRGDTLFIAGSTLPVWGQDFGSVAFEFGRDSLFSSTIATDSLLVGDPMKTWNFRLLPGRSFYVRLFGNRSARVPSGGKVTLRTGPSPAIRLQARDFREEAPILLGLYRYTLPITVAVPVRDVGARYTKVPWAESTLVQLSEDPGFSTVFGEARSAAILDYDEIKRGTANLTIPLPEMQRDTRYYLRARSSFRDLVTAWSTPESFPTDLQLHPPALLEPADRSVTAATTTTLRWRKVKGATGHFLTITCSCARQTFYPEKEFNTDSSLTLKDLPAGDYTWYLRAALNGGYSGFISRTFTVPVAFPIDSLWYDRIFPIEKGNRWTYEYRMYGKYTRTVPPTDEQYLDTTYVTSRLGIAEVDRVDDSLIFAIDLIQERTKISNHHPHLRVDTVHDTVHSRSRHKFFRLNGLPYAARWDEPSQLWAGSPGTSSSLFDFNVYFLFNVSLLKKAWFEWNTYGGKHVARIHASWEPDLNWEMIQGFGMTSVYATYNRYSRLGNTEDRVHYRLLSFNGNPFVTGSNLIPSGPPPDWTPVAIGKPRGGLRAATWAAYLRESTDWTEAVLYSAAGKRLFAWKPGMEIRTDPTPAGMCILRVRERSGIRVFKVVR